MSAEGSRPWWATPEDAGHVDDRDPLTAHRAARRGGNEEVPPGAGSADDADAMAGHDPDVCGVCPWCAGLRMLSSSHPEVVGHLTDAARHLTQAVRALVVDLQAAGGTGESNDEAPFEHIDLD